MEFTLLGAAAIAIAATYATLWFEAGRTNAADCTTEVWDDLLAALVAGLVAGRVGAMILAGTNPLTAPGDLLVVRGGVDTIVAAAAGLGAFAVAARSDLWRLADAAAPAAVSGLAGWHAGCLVRDTCLGTPSGLPWAMSQAGSEVARHPVELYAAIALAALAVGLVLWKRVRRPPGLVAAVAVAGAAVVRAATEPLRVGLGGDLASWYWGAAAAFTGLAVWRARAGPASAGD